MDTAVTDPVFGDEKIKFPVQCHFKVIADGPSDEMKKAISEALAALDIAVPVSGGNKSSSGRYITYNITIHVQSKEEMLRIDGSLRTISGVRMVL